MANLSQEKREHMQEFLKAIKNEYKNDDEILMAISEIENELYSKKYGIIWEQHEERVDQIMQNNIPVFTEEKDREITTIPGESYNFLLEGDNLHSLKLLQKTHSGRIDVIYIDPPYNTEKRDFKYDDKYIDENDGFKHSKWLSFMNERMSIAYDLLSDDGLLFVSIDDHEQAMLKCLLDEIFTEQNFIITLPRITKNSGKTTGSFSKNHDYVLVYTKRNQNIFSMEEHDDPDYKYEDEFAEERGKYKLNQTLDYDSLSYSTSLDYPIEIEGETFYPGSDKTAWERRQSGDHKRADWAWRWCKEKFDFGYKNGFIVIKRQENGTKRIYSKTYQKVEIKKISKGKYCLNYFQRTKAMSSIELTKKEYSNDNAKKNLKEFGLEDEFEYSKPVELIKRLIKHHYNKDAIVLDFFAGSGTTAQAVLELNAEDGGHRQFILCTDNENQICEQVTYKRCSDVITMHKFTPQQKTLLWSHKIIIKDFPDKKSEKGEDNEDSDDGELTIPQQIEQVKIDNKGLYNSFKTEIKDEHISLYGITRSKKMTGLPANLKYYRTDFVSMDAENVAEELQNHVAEMVQMEHGIKLDGQNYIMILSDEDADRLEEHWDEYEHIKALYVSRDVLFTASQRKLFNDMEINIIPDYYFKFELQKAGEVW